MKPAPLKTEDAEASTAATVLVVDDDVSIRESLELLIVEGGWTPQLFASAESFLAHRQVSGPRCLVLDVTLPDLNGLDLQRRIAVDQQFMPIIFISGYGDVPMTVQAMRAGAFEFLTKPYSDDVVLRAIRSAVAQSKTALSEEAAFRSMQNCYRSLTPRERDIMKLVVSGLLNKEIGSELGISEITVKAHRGSVMRKMAAGSLADLVRIEARLAQRGS